MASTIRDVAERAGVSVATVSRFLNGTGKLRPKTAERVRAAIDELGFRPNAVGRSLSTAHTKSIGVVIPSLSNPVFAEAVSGINEVARAAGYTLMFTATDYDRDTEVDAVSALLEYRVDGLILTVADAADSPVLDMIEELGIAYTLLYNHPCRADRPTVTVDNVAAGRAVARALLDLGHRRVAMISGRFAASDRARARRDGFVAALRDADAPEPLISEVDFVDLDVGEVLEAVVGQRGDAPTALFCSNDLLAISVVGALGRMGLAVPDDISVIGFDGIAVGTHLHPTLATVVQPSREMGRRAAKHVLARLSGASSPESAILPHELRLGESAGPAAKPSPADLQKPVQPVRRKSTT